MALSLRRKLGGGSGGSSGDGSVSVDVVIKQDDLRDLVRAINKHGDAKAIRKALRTGLREAVKPLVPRARQAVLSAPVRRAERSHTAYRQVKSGKNAGSARAYQSFVVATTGLRKDMARTVQVKVDLGLRSERIGVRIRLDPAKLRTHPKGIVPMYEGVKPWRHPSFGDRDVWVQQEPRGFLTEVVTAGRPAVMRDIEKAMQDIGKRIDKG